MASMSNPVFFCGVCNHEYSDTEATGSYVAHLQHELKEAESSLAAVTARVATLEAALQNIIENARVVYDAKQIAATALAEGGGK